MENVITKLFMALGANPVVQIIFLWIMADTFFGVFRAIKEGKFNSSFGIDGGIRKVGMVFSVLFLGIADFIVHINLVAFIPVEYLEFLGLQKVGLLEFFGFLFILYETISILKNMYLCGIPMPLWLKQKLETLLTQLTNEMPQQLNLDKVE